MIQTRTIRPEVMRTKTIRAALFAATMLFAAAAIAQAARPAPELKKLDVFVGQWTLNGNMKAGAMGHGGSMTESEKCEWMEGNFYLVCNFDYKSSAGNGVGLSVMGYSTDLKAYTYRQFNSYGEFEDAKGSLDGDTWTWNSEQTMGGQTMKWRFTMSITSTSSYTYVFDMSLDGTKWSTVMDGKATKK